MKVFISHITEEAALASILKDWIESTFLGQVDVFVSSYDISSGEQWFSRLAEELADAKAMLVLCSETSVSKPWINFEAGAGHVKGVPVTPICFAGVTKDTLPAPLSFFQGLDVNSEDFAVKVIGDLAGHLGYARTPQIRHEEMTADLEAALTQLGQESGNNVSGDLGYVDHVVLVSEKTEALTSLISEFGVSANEMTVGLNKFSGQLESARNNPSSGGPRQVQRISKKLGESLSVYANKYEDLNRKYGRVLPDVKSSLQNVLTLTDIDTASGMEDMNRFLVTLEETEQSIAGWRESVISANDAISALPNFQRDMKRGARKVSEQLDTLTSHLDDTIDMIQDARATCNNRLERKSLGQEP